MRTVEYTPQEIREGAVIVHSGRTLTVAHVYFRRGRGLELHTREADGYLGPVIWPDESLSVVYMPELSDDDLWHLERTTRDYPWSTPVA
jgi:hypothetical protein